MPDLVKRTAGPTASADVDLILAYSAAAGGAR